MLDKPIALKYSLFRGVPLFFSSSFEGNPFSGMKFCRKILETLGYNMVKTRSLYLTFSWIGTGS